MKLLLYSGGLPEEIFDMDAQLLRMIGLSNPKVTLIPSSYEHSEEDYQDYLSHFGALGLPLWRVLHADRVESSAEMEEALQADFVFLSGGNTFYFLESLRRSRLLKLLSTYAQSDRVLAGESAGAILMTPTIQTAAFPEFDRDENASGLKNLRAMGLVPFEFFPHFQSSRAYDSEFESYTQSSKRPLYACPDGSGVIIDGVQMIFVGHVAAYFNGKKFWLK